MCDSGRIGERAAPSEAVFHRLPQEANTPRVFVQRFRSFHSPSHGTAVVIAIIFANAGKVVNHVDAMFLQQFRLANAGKFKQLRRLHCAGGKDDLSIGCGFDDSLALRVANAGRAAVFNENTMSQGSRGNGEVRARTRRVQECPSGAEPAAVLLRDLIDAEAFLGFAVVVWIARIAGLFAGLYPSIQQRVLLHHVRNVQFATVAAVVVASSLEMFGAFEDRQYILERPAAIAELRPGVVVQRLTTHVQHAVDGT